MIRLDIIIPNIQMSQLWEPVWSENKKLHPVIVIKVNYNIVGYYIKWNAVTTSNRRVISMIMDITENRHFVSSLDRIYSIWSVVVILKENLSVL